MHEQIHKTPAAEMKSKRKIERTWLVFSLFSAFCPGYWEIFVCAMISPGREGYHCLR
jgi:hypothetical protein